MEYTVSFFSSVSNARVEHTETLSLDELSNLLTTYHCVDTKDSVPLFNLARFKTIEEGASLARKYSWVNNERQDDYTEIPNTIRRCKDNLVSLSGLVLDVDKEYSIESIIKKLDGIYMIIYTTFRHTWEHNKFRVIIPFSRPLLAKDIPTREKSICQVFPGVDHASFTVSQCFYLHSSNNVDNSFSVVIDGELIDPYWFEEEVIEPVIPKSYSDFNLTNGYVESVVKSLLSCSNIHYDGWDGNKNSGVLTLVSICRSIGLSYEEYDMICSSICSSDSQLRFRNVRKAAWDGWKVDRITREKRDYFIKANGGIVNEVKYLGYGKLTNKPIKRLKLQRS